ncbi:unnamed protein product [Tilletia controversa]|nr:unnamed protein product [Tilletia controversa]
MSSGGPGSPSHAPSSNFGNVISSAAAAADKVLFSCKLPANKPRFNAEKRERAAQYTAARAVTSAGPPGFARAQNSLSVSDLQFDPNLGFDTDLPMPPKLAGLWMGDGISQRPSIIVSSTDEPTVTFMERINAKGPKVSAFRNALTELGMLNNKAGGIPDLIMNGSLSDRLAFLAGFIESDGCYDTKARTYILKQNGEDHRKMIEDAKQMAESCGIGATKILVRSSQFTNHETDVEQKKPPQICSQAPAARDTKDEVIAILVKAFESKKIRISAAQFYYYMLPINAGLMHEEKSSGDG